MERRTALGGGQMSRMIPFCNNWNHYRPIWTVFPWYDQCVKRKGRRPLMMKFAWLIIHALFQMWGNICWNDSNRRLWKCDDRWTNEETRPHLGLSACGCGSNIKGHWRGHQVGGACLLNSQSFRLAFHLPPAADLFRSATARRAWLSRLPDKGPTVPSVLFRPRICPQSDEITAMQCLPHIKSIHGLTKMLFCKWRAARLMLHRQA